MSKFAQLLKVAGNTLNAHSPQILTGMAVAGVISTVVLAVKATPEATNLVETARVKKLHEFEEERAESSTLTPLETVKAAWVCYIPATAVGSVTIACILLSTRIASKRNAVLMSAFTLVEGNFREYQDKVVQHIGKNKERAVQDAISEDRVKANPVSSREVIITSKGDVLCFDQLTGRYFRSDMQTLRKAENDLNQKIINEGNASQNDYYRMIGLPVLDHGDELGWTTDQLLNLSFTSVLSENDEPCLAVKFSAAPIRGYYHNYP